MKEHSHSRRALALLLAVVLCFSLIPTAFAAQQNSYHDPAEHWLSANDRTNELDANAVVTHETFRCGECNKQTSFLTFRTPEYTKDGKTAMSRNVQFSDGTLSDGQGKGSLLNGTPGQDAYYTGYHFTKAICETCGGINTNRGKSDYGYLKNVYWLHDCDVKFTEDLEETISYTYADSQYHTVTSTGGTYCCFCYGTNHTKSSKLVRHEMETEILSQPANGRFVRVEKCRQCDYASYTYTTAKAVVASYYGVADGKPHTISVTDLSESGVRATIRYGNSADACTLSSAPNYTEAGQYTVYYAITYTYKGQEMTENGVAYVWLREQGTKENGSCACGCGQMKQTNTPKGEHNYAVHTVAATCTMPGYTVKECIACGDRHITDMTAALPHNYEATVISATCEAGGKSIHRCEGCGSAFVTDATEALGHTWDKGTLVTNATCTGEGMMEYRCIRCGYHRLEGNAASGHDYKVEVIQPTCTEMGYTIHTCTRCGDTYQDSYTKATGHKPGDWIIDRQPTTNTEGSKHKECQECGETLDTQPMEKIKNEATTDSNGEAIVGGYLVTVTDTDTKAPVANARVSLSQDDTISIRLPSGRLLDYADQTTVTVQLVKDKSPVVAMPIAVTDHNDNYASGKTDKAGQITVPSGSGETNEDGKATGGYEDADGERWTLTVKVERTETGRPVPHAIVTIGKTGHITVQLPDGTDMDQKHHITVTVTDHKKVPQKNLTVIVKGDLEQNYRDKTDQKGQVTVPEIAQTERHGIYIEGYPDGSFGPERGMTRAEAATIFARLLAEKNGDNISTVARTKFDDIPAHAWYSGYVKYLNNHGVAYGKTKTTFAPDDAITRAEYTALAVRFFEVYGDGSAEIMEKYKSFDDVSEGDWAASYIQAAAKYGWVNGYEDGSFHPSRQITRAEVVTLTNRMLGRSADEVYVQEHLRQLNTFHDLSKRHWAYYEVMESANAHTAVLGKNETWSK